MTLKNAGNGGKPEIKVEQAHAVMVQRLSQRTCQRRGRVDG